MSMSTHITGFAPPDANWQRMKAVWDACQEAEVTEPEEVTNFFDGETPDPTGVEVALPHREWSDANGVGYEIDVADIPPQVKTIRFYNSY